MFWMGQERLANGNFSRQGKRRNEKFSLIVIGRLIWLVEYHLVSPAITVELSAWILIFWLSASPSVGQIEDRCFEWKQFEAAAFAFCLSFESDLK